MPHGRLDLGRARRSVAVKSFVKDFVCIIMVPKLDWIEMLRNVVLWPLPSPVQFVIACFVLLKFHDIVLRLLEFLCSIHQLVEFLLCEAFTSPIIMWDLQ